MAYAYRDRGKGQETPQEKGSKMLNRRGYSYGAAYPIHYEQRLDGWAVFDARNDKDIQAGLKEWEAQKLCISENGNPKPCLEDIDDTP